MSVKSWNYSKGFVSDAGQKLTQLMHLINDGEFGKAKSRCELFPNEASISCIVNDCEMLPIHLFFERLWSNPINDSKMNNKLENVRIFADLSEIMKSSTKSMKFVVDKHLAIDDEIAKETLFNTLIHANPDGLKTRNGMGSLPLHIACKNKTSTSFIRRLIDEYDEGVKIIDAHARLPLHFACEPCDAVIHAPTIFLLVAKYFESTLIGDINGLTPLNMLKMLGKASVAKDVVDMISDKRPNLYSLSEEEERALKRLSSLRNSDSMAYKSNFIQEHSRSVEMRENWADILNEDVGI